MAYYRNQYQPRYPRPQASQGPRQIVAKYPSVCKHCKREIAVGDVILWAPGQPAVHPPCAIAAENAASVPSFVSPVSEIADAATDWEAKDKAEAAFGALRGRLEVEDAGVYVLEDGTIVKVQANREKSRVYAKRFVAIRGERATEAGTRERGEYQYEAGLIDQVSREGRKMTLEEAKAFIIRYGFCVRCGRVLKAAESVERGIGPVCVTYFEAGHEGHSHA